MSRHQKGFALLELLLIVVVVAVLGFIGYKVYQTHQNRAVSSQSSSGSIPPKSIETSTAAPATAVPDVTQKSDLDAAQKQLDQNDNSADTTDQSMLSGQENDF
jgi:Tfp pilus assembly protein PilE